MLRTFLPFLSVMTSVPFLSGLVRSKSAFHVLPFLKEASATVPSSRGADFPPKARVY